MVHLLDLPAEIFDHIIAGIFDAEHGYAVEVIRSNPQMDAIKRNQPKKTKGEHVHLRRVHSRFRESVDIHLFRTFRIGCGVEPQVEQKRESFLTMTTSSSILKHARVLCLETTALLPATLSPEGFNAGVSRLVEVLNFVSSRLEVLAIGFFRHDETNMWHTLKLANFASLRSLFIQDADFTFCVPYISHSAPLLECISLDGFELEGAYGGMRTIDNKDELAAYVSAYPMRPFKRLILCEPEKRWLHDFLTISKPQPSEILLELYSRKLEPGCALEVLRSLTDDNPFFTTFELRESEESMDGYYFAEGAAERVLLFERLKDLWKGKDVKMSMQTLVDNWSGALADMEVIVEYS